MWIGLRSPETRAVTAAEVAGEPPLRDGGQRPARVPLAALARRRIAGSPPPRRSIVLRLSHTSSSSTRASVTMMNVLPARVRLAARRR